MPIGIQDIWRVPQNVAATERAREQGQRAERKTNMNIAVQKQGLKEKAAMAEIEKQQKKAEVAYSKLNFANRMLSTVKDDESLARARDQYLKIYPEDRANVERVMPGKYNKKMVDQAKLELRTMSGTLKPLTLSAGQKAVDPVTGEVIAEGAEKKKSMSIPELTARKLAGDQEAGAILDEMQKQKEGQFGEPYVDKSTGALMQKNIKTGKVNKIAAPPKGMIIESDGAGGFTMRTGVPTGADITKKTQGAIEAKLLGGQEQLKRMRIIQRGFKPEYQELGARLARAWTGLKAHVGMDVSEDEKTKLSEYKSFQRKAIENINLYIKELTGAQMSEKEADRLRLAQPDPGEKWYLGDDPITFKAKMDDVIKFAGASVARYNKYRAEGLSDNEIKQLAKDDMLEPLDNFIQNQAEKVGATEDIPRPETQEDYNSLPTGTIYIDPDDGKKYRK